MRWEELFADLEGQVTAAVRAEEEDLIAELAEAESGTTALIDRLRACRGARLRLRLRTGEDLEGVVLDAAPEWILLGERERRLLVPATAVHAAWPLGIVAPEAGEVERRLRITHVLRGLARQGDRVRVSCDGGAYSGWLTRVGRDHLDLRPLDGGPVLTVALASVLWVSGVEAYR